MIDPKNLLSAMSVASEKARSILMGYFSDLAGKIHITEKGKADFVSQADLESENAIRSYLEAEYPDSGFLLEEGGRVGDRSDLRWIVDPLDGTANFVRGLPFFSISIAAEVNGILVAGLVHDPLRDETFTAAVGGGAFLNGMPIAVSQTTVLHRAMISSGLPYRSKTDFPSFQNASLRLMSEGVTMRRTGSAALDLCYTAAGRLDGHFAVGLSPWDVAAGMVICREAGVRVETGILPDKFSTGSMLSANGVLYQKMIDAISIEQ